MLSAQTAARFRDVCFLMSSEPGQVEGMFDDAMSMKRLRQFLRGTALTPDAARALADAVRRHTYPSQKSLDLAGLREEICLRWQRATPHALVSLFKAPGIWSAIAADILPAGASLRHAVLPFVPDACDLADILLAAFAAGITSVEVTFPPPGHASSPYKLDLSDWVPLPSREKSERLVLWIKCGPDAQGSVFAPPGVDLGVHPLTGVHVPGVRICETVLESAMRAANDSSTPRSVRGTQGFDSAAASRRSQPPLQSHPQAQRQFCA
jgi:hypothetical protein